MSKFYEFPVPVSVSWKECVQETVQLWVLTWLVSSLNEALGGTAGNEARS